MPWKSQLRALIWKNFVLAHHTKTILLFELGVPLVFSFIVFMGRHSLSKYSLSEEITFPTDERFLARDVREEVLVAYYPECPATSKLMKHAGNVLKASKLHVQGFTSIEGGHNFIKASTARIKLSLIMFDGLTTSSIIVPADLRFRLFTDSPQIEKEENYNPTGDEYEIYKSQTIMGAQKLVTETFISYWRARRQEAEVAMSLGTQSMPNPFAHSGGHLAILDLVAPLIILSYATVVMHLTIMLAQERRHDLKDFMKLIGVESRLYWLAWFLLGFYKCLLVTLILTFFLCLETTRGSVLGTTRPEVVFVFLLLYSLDALSFSFLTASFTRKSTSTAIYTLVAYIFLYILASLNVQSGSISTVWIIFGVPLFQIGFMIGMEAITRREKKDDGYSFLNLQDAASSDRELSLSDGVLLIMANIIFNIIGLIYIDIIHSVKKRNSWSWLLCGMKERRPPVQEAPAQEVPDNTLGLHEKEILHLNVGIKLRRVTKVYGEQLVLSDLTVDVFENQITVLLGHNGTGKTTLINIITGFISPTQGQAVVNGESVVHNLGGARKHLGLCPQVETLFENLTCWQHFQFYCMVKGLKYQDVTNDLFKAFGLTDHRDILVKKLSDSEKRKLLVVGAFIGDPKVVILDEPTSGMDPSVQRLLWNLFQKYSQGRTILITTHNMTEAEEFGNRILILDKGIIRYSGSASFLKKTFGVTDFRLIITTLPGCRAMRVEKVIKRIIPTAIFLGEKNDQLLFQLSNDSTKRLDRLCFFLEEQDKFLKIDSFTFNSTSLDEVFQQIGHGYKRQEFAKEAEGQVDQKAEDSGDKRKKPEPELQTEFIKNSGFCLKCQQVVTLFKKNVTLTYRNWTSTLFQMFMPCVLLFLALHVAGNKRVSKPGVHLPLWLTLKNMKGSNVTIFIHKSANLDLVEKYKSLITSPDVVSVIDMNNTDVLFDREMQTLGWYFTEKAETLGDMGYTARLVIGAAFFSMDLGGQTVALYNARASHAAVLSTQYVLNAYVKLHLGDEYSVLTGVTSKAIHTHPQQPVKDNSCYTFFTTFALAFGLAILPALFAHRPLYEKEIGAKHLQWLCGVEPASYWLSTFLWDMIIYGLVAASLLGTLGVSSCIPHEHFRMISILLGLFGVAMLPNVYVMQMMFASSSDGISIIVLFNLFIGVLGSLFVTSFQIGAMGTKLLNHVVTIVNIIFSFISPVYNVSTSLTLLTAPIIISEAFASGRYGIDEVISQYMVIPDYKYQMLVMIVQTYLYAFLLLVIDLDIFHHLRWKFKAEQSGDQNAHADQTSEDMDVLNENTLVNTTALPELLELGNVVVKNLHKKYGDLVAVNGLCLALASNECFGLLGSQGTGKSSILKMVTGLERMSSGEIYVFGHRINSDMSLARPRIGYCPQVNALHDRLTGREILYLYCRLRGAAEQEVAGLVNEAMDIMALTPHADKLTSKYSYGMKRKLSTAVAVIGYPKILLLDEPTVGLDPMARLALWEFLAKVKQLKSRTIVVASNSIERMESHCTRIGIMVAGQLKCLGTPVHLKERFASDHTIILNLKPTSQEFMCHCTQALELFLSTNLPEIVLLDREFSYLHYQLPQSKIKMSRIFKVLEKLRDFYDLQDYNVRQTTLEHVYLYFAKGCHMVSSMLLRHFMTDPLLFTTARQSQIEVMRVSHTNDLASLPESRDSDSEPEAGAVSGLVKLKIKLKGKQKGRRAGKERRSSSKKRERMVTFADEKYDDTNVM